MGDSFLERFWARVDVRGPDECWVWTGGRNSREYGVVWPRGSTNIGAHRLSWELANAVPIPAGLFICHRCDNPPCVNPAHLFLGTHQDNMRDAIAKGRMRYAERLIDLTGQRFGAWTVLRRDTRKGVGAGTRWFVRCDCGRESSINGQQLRRGHTAQCRKCARPWRAGMVVGGRVLLRPASSGWIVQCEKCGLRTQNTPSLMAERSCRRCGPSNEDTHGRMVTVGGETHNLAGWARKLGISREAMRLRLLRGMSPEAACTTTRAGYGGIRLRGAA